MTQRKAALVTGAATGIGAATVRAFAGRGVDVAINHLGDGDIAEAEVTAAECRRAGVRAHIIQADVGNPDQCRTLIDRAVAVLGRLDYLVNNAGYTKGRALNDLDSVEPIEFQRTFEVNCMGPFFLSRYAVPHLRATGAGAIVNIASTAGLTGIGSSHPYCASKAALINLTRSLARVIGPQVRMNAVCPGLVNTAWPKRELGDQFAKIAEMAGSRMVTGKIIEPEDVAETVVFLAMGATQVTGEIVRVDGGSHLGVG
jgi:NAD(P)-dependent dehydrogenase (short-subunit alcohol dehydrogenase family)